MAGAWFGVGLRSQHADEIAAAAGAVDWYELLSDNYVGVGGARRALLERVRRDHPVALHGIGLSIAGSDPLDPAYLRGLRDLADSLDPAFVGDHLSWTSLGGHTSHDLLPVAYTGEVLDHVVARVGAVQDFLGRRLLLENASAYVAFRADAIAEADFFAALCRRSGCGMLLDVNNLFVNAANLGTDPDAYLAAIPRESVGYLHLAGHAVLADVRIDTHDADVPGAVWELYESAVRRFPDVPVIIERDDKIPAFAALVAEAEQARTRHAAMLARPQSGAPQRARSQSNAPASDGVRWEATQKGFFERVVDKPLGFEHAGVEGLLDADRPVRAARGMRVYSDAYTASLRRALATQFAALARVLRADDFTALASAYLRAHPPRGHDFTSIGAALAEFVRSFSFRAAYAVGHVALAELVALEQAQLEVQAAPDEPSLLTPAALARIPAEQWDEARFAFSRSFRLLRATHDVLPAVESAAGAKDPPRPEPADVSYLVYRTASGVRTERLPCDEARALESLVAGSRFAVACRATACDTDDETLLVENGVRALLRACERGLIVSLVAAS